MSLVGIVATMPYEEYLKRRTNISNAYLTGQITLSEYREQRFMLEAQYWLGI